MITSLNIQNKTNKRKKNINHLKFFQSTVCNNCTFPTTVLLDFSSLHVEEKRAAEVKKRAKIRERFDEFHAENSSLYKSFCNVNIKDGVSFVFSPQDRT